MINVHGGTLTAASVVLNDRDYRKFIGVTFKNCCIYAGCAVKEPVFIHCIFDSDCLDMKYLSKTLFHDCVFGVKSK